jgi:hypothetical protein
LGTFFLDKDLARVDIGFSRKKPPGILPFKGKKVNLMPLQQALVKQCGVMRDAAAKGIGRANQTNFHFLSSLTK